MNAGIAVNKNELPRVVARSGFFPGPAPIRWRGDGAKKTIR